MPGRVIIPSTVDDVVKAVGATRAAGLKLRCIAHGDTWTPVFFDEVSIIPSQVDCNLAGSWPVQMQSAGYHRTLIQGPPHS